LIEIEGLFAWFPIIGDLGRGPA